MKRLGGLFEQVASFEALRLAARRAARGRATKPDVARFLLELEPEVLVLERRLRDGSYRPGSYRVFRVRDPKPRTISAAPFRDRVVHHAVCAVLEPIFEAYAIAHSYACREGKGTQAAVRRAQHIARRRRFYLKLDVRRFFETADHDVLRRSLRRHIKDPGMLALLDVIIQHGAPGSPAGRGLPIGNLTSQHFANFYLGALDHFVTDRLGAGAYCRYMDDVIIGADDKTELWRVHDAVGGYLEDALRLELRAEVTRVAPVTEGIPFLGFRIWPALVRFDRQRRRRFAARLRALDRALANGAIDEDTAARSGASLVGWAAHADTRALRASIVARLEDARMR